MLKACFTISVSLFLLVAAGCSRGEQRRFEGTWHQPADTNVALYISADAMRVDLKQVQLVATYRTQKIDRNELQAVASAEGRQFAVRLTLGDDGQSIRITGGPPFGGRWVRSFANENRDIASHHDSKGVDSRVTELQTQ